MTLRALLLPLAAALVPLGPAAAAAQPAAATGPIRLELNRLEPREGGGCRVWLVLANGAAEAVDPLRLDLVLFGRDGVVARRLAVDVGPLPAGRTVVRLFDLAGQPCGGVGQVLLNDVLACGGGADAAAAAAAAARTACTARAALASRVDGVAFLK